jgi:hypothetical protein
MTVMGTIMDSSITMNILDTCAKYVARLAPIIEELTTTGMLSSVQFNCSLRDSDTTHDRNGYSLNIVIMCSSTSEICDYLKNVCNDENLRFIPIVTISPCRNISVSRVLFLLHIK